MSTLESGFSPSCNTIGIVDQVMVMGARWEQTRSAVFVTDLLVTSAQKESLQSDRNRTIDSLEVKP